ncbi:hypothetical protein [Haloarcula pelagica]|uniref:hypothetical protein n=1 Tax=Haloarcula pelagica TaxID=3033389 RepID=UPI0024C3A471|nr:hypothetical protein [Halomicroarcula sp. YJ-61-S]
MVYVNLLILFLAAKSQRIMVEKTSSYATKGADMFSGTAKTGLVLGATAVGGTATGSMVSAGMKAKEGKAASMEAYQLHRSLSSKQPPQAESSTDDDSESAETPPSSGSSADAASNDGSSNSSDSGTSGSSEESVSGGNLWEDNENIDSMKDLFQTDRKDIPTDGADGPSSPDPSTNGIDGPKSGQTADAGGGSSPSNGDSPTGWYSITSHGETPDGAAMVDASQDDYSQGDRVVVDNEDFDYAEKRAIVTDAADGELKVHPETRDLDENMTVDPDDVVMYEHGPEVDRTFSEGTAVRITADDFEGSDARATVTKPPVPGKEATVRPVNMPGEVKVPAEKLAASPTGSTPRSIDNSDVEPVVPPGWGKGGTPDSEPPTVEPEPLHSGDSSADMEPEQPTPVGGVSADSDTQAESPTDTWGSESVPDRPTDTGESDSPTVESEPLHSGESGADMDPEPLQGSSTNSGGSDPVSADPPQPGDEVPDTDGVDTPGRSPAEITDSSPGDQPPQGRAADSTTSTTELTPSDIVENPDADKYQQGFSDGSPDTSQPPTSQTTAQPDSNSAPQSTSSSSPGASEGGSQQPDSATTDTEESTVGSDSGQSIKDALATDDEVLGPEAYAEPFTTENTESDD